MSQQRRLEPLKRGKKKSTGTWADVQAPHPGVRDPRAIRIDDWPLALNATIISLCFLLTAFALLSASIASPVGTADHWTHWSESTRDVSLDYPRGWTARNLGAGEDLHVVVMRSPWVRVHIVSESELASAASVYTRMGGDARYQALERLHRQTADTWSTFFGEVDEGRTTRTVIGQKRAVWSQFTYTGTVLESDEPMRGYRATMLGPRSGVIASAVAPAEHWREFQPIALQILRSIRLDHSGG